MQVYKFGGASIKDAASIRSVFKIVSDFKENELLIVISAAGKITNALENVLNDFYRGNTEQAMKGLDEVKDFHLKIMSDLFEDHHPVYAEVNDLFVDVLWLLEEEVKDSYDYLYDQVVSLGELISTTIVATFFNEQGLSTQWMDARDLIMTDNQYRDANILWKETFSKVNSLVVGHMKNKIVLTQGFIGGTSENYTTTLGREGSDFSAAIFSYCLNVSNMTIWKDVPGVLNADPRIFSKVQMLEQLSYTEAIEMTYYGAQVIHPKTIRPLQNKKIPMSVRSFLDLDQQGSRIADYNSVQYPPIIVVKKDQVLLKIESKDLFFINEAKFSILFTAFDQCRIKVNMTQNTALAFSVCVDNDPAKIEQFIEKLSDEYFIEYFGGLKLITIRHADDAFYRAVSRNKKIYLEEKIRSNIQLLVDESEQIDLE